MGNLQEYSESYKTKLTDMISNFLKIDGQGGTGRISTGPTRRGWQDSCARSEPVNQAQCGRGAQTDCYLNRQTRGSVCRLHPATGGGG